MLRSLHQTTRLIVGASQCQYYPQSGPAQMPPVYGYAQPPAVVVASMEVAAIPSAECADASLAVSRDDNSIHAIGDVADVVPIEPCR